MFLLSPLSFRYAKDMPITNATKKMTAKMIWPLENMSFNYFNQSKHKNTIIIVLKSFKRKNILTDITKFTEKF